MLVNERQVQLLVEMVVPFRCNRTDTRFQGYSETRAKKALILTRGTINDAIEWLSDHATDPDIDIPFSEEELERESYAMGIASSSTNSFPVMGVPSMSGSLPLVVHPDGKA